MCSLFDSGSIVRYSIYDILGVILRDNKYSGVYKMAKIETNSNTEFTWFDIFEGIVNAILFIVFVALSSTIVYKLIRGI